MNIQFMSFLFAKYIGVPATYVNFCFNGFFRKPTKIHMWTLFVYENVSFMWVIKIIVSSLESLNSRAVKRALLSTDKLFPEDFENYGTTCYTQYIHDTARKVWNSW